MKIADRLKELQLTLPEVQPAGNYRPAVKAGSLVFVSGQLPKVEGKVAFKGRVGKDVSLETARRAAKAALLNALAALEQEVGSLDKVKQIVKVTGYINSYPGFYDQSKVMDGASDLLVEIFGERGPHSRVAVGVVELPQGAAIEIEMVVEVR